MEGSNKVIDMIEENVSLLYKLDKAGIKCINTALDYMVIFYTYKSHSAIKDITERKELTAERCKVSVRTVSNAISVLDQKI